MVTFSDDINVIFARRFVFETPSSTKHLIPVLNGIVYYKFNHYRILTFDSTCLQNLRIFLTKTLKQKPYAHNNK